jgi:hypothetical protein
MSFHFSLSSGSEDEGDEFEEEDEGFGFGGFGAAARNDDNAGNDAATSSSCSAAVVGVGTIPFVTPETSLSPFASVTAAPTSDNEDMNNGGDWEDEHVNWGNEDINEENGEGEGEDEDSVDWEEGHDGDTDVNDLSAAQKEQLAKLTSGAGIDDLNLKEITFDFGDGEQTNGGGAKDDKGTTTTSKKKKKRAKRLRQLTVSHDTELLLVNLHRAHRLSLTAHLIHLQQLSLARIHSTTDHHHQDGQHDDEWSLLMHLAYSLIPDEYTLRSADNINSSSSSGNTSHSVPTPQQLHAFAKWYFNLVNHYVNRIRNQRQRDVAMGAPNTYGNNGRVSRADSSPSPSVRRRSSRNSNANTATPPAPVVSDTNAKEEQRNDNVSHNNCNITSSNRQRFSPMYIRFRRMIHSLTKSVNPDYLVPEEEDAIIEHMDPATIMSMTPLDKTLLFLFICRNCLGWKRLRLVTALQPMPLHLTMDHPLLQPSSTSNYHVDLTQDEEQSPKNEPMSMETWRALLQLVHLTYVPVEGEVITIMEEEDSKPAAKKQAAKKGGRKRRASKRAESSKVGGANNKSAMKADESSPRDEDRGSQQRLSLTAENTQNPLYVWVEVLCRIDNVGSSEGKEHRKLPPISAKRQRRSRSYPSQKATATTNADAGGNSKVKSKSKWIPLDIPHELMNQPLLVEDILTSVRAESSRHENGDSVVLGDEEDRETMATPSGGKKTFSGKGSGSLTKPPPPSKSSGRKRPRGPGRGRWIPTMKESGKANLSTTRHSSKLKAIVSYVVAAEFRHAHASSSTAHVNDNHNPCPKIIRALNLTDVTPRYATKWSQTLLKRGATKKQTLANGGKCVDSWWVDCLKAINRVCSDASAQTANQVVPKKDNHNGVIHIDVSDAEEERDCKPIAKKNASVKKNHPDYSDSENVDGDEDDTEDENEELQDSIVNETIPTSKAAFKNHPIYVLASQLKEHEVLTPDAKRHVCGLFKGELVYRRAGARSEAWPERKWLYKGRQVRLAELRRPAKLTKARRKAQPEGFQALKSYGTSSDNQDQNNTTNMAKKSHHHKSPEDLAREKMLRELDTGDDEMIGKIRLYGKWQTVPWSPKPVGPNDPIPMNDYRNIELALLNPGLVHLDQVHMAKVAKKLSIPYTPCLLGFEQGKGGNRTPTIRGIVVHQHNASLLRSAFEEYHSFTLEQEHQKRQADIYLKWKKLIVGVLTKARLERDYGDGKS